MATLESLGLGSGVLNNDLIDKLIKAEREGTDKRLDMRQELTEAKITAYGEINSRLSTMQDASIALSSPTLTGSTKASSSNETILGATTGLGAEPGVYEVEVKNTAKAHSIATGKYSSMDEVVGTGKLTFAFGELEYDNDGKVIGQKINPNHPGKTITIDESNRTLSGIRDAINKADMGVRASIVNDGTGYRLQIVSTETGKENAMTIQATDSTGAMTTSGLGAFNFNQDVSALEQTSQAEDARISVNGLEIIRASNDIDEVIKGVTLNVKNADINNKVVITVEADLEELTKTIDTFIGAYNELKEFVDDLSRYDESKKTGGLLMGDSSVRSMMDGLRAMISAPIVGVNGKYRSLTELGVNTDKDNNFLLKFDKAVFNKAMKDDRNDVINVLSKGGHTTDSQITYMNDSVNTQPGEYDVVITQLATQAKYQGSQVLDFTQPVIVDDSNNTFAINVNGVNATIKLTNGSYATGDDLAKEIAMQINGDKTLKERGHSVTVDYVDGRFDITSNMYGSASQIYISQSTPGASNILGLAPQGGGAYKGLELNSLGADAFANGGLTLDSAVEFKIEVDGITSAIPVQVPAGTYATPEDLRAAIQQALADTINDPSSGFNGVESPAQLTGRNDLASAAYPADFGFTLTVNGETHEIIANGNDQTDLLANLQTALDSKFTGNNALTASIDVDGQLVLTSIHSGSNQTIRLESDGRGARTQVGTQDLTNSTIDFTATPASFELEVAGQTIAVMVDANEGDTLSSIQKALDRALEASGEFDSSDVLARLDENGNLYFETWRKQMTWGSEVAGSEARIEIKNSDASAQGLFGITDGEGHKGYDALLGMSGGAFVKGDNLEPQVTYKQSADGQSGSFDIVLGSLGKKIRFTELSDGASSILGLQDKAFYKEAIAKGTDVEGTIDGVKATGEGQFLRAQSGTESATNGYYLGNEITSFPLVLDSTNNKFKVSVDGVETEISVDQRSYGSGEELAEALQKAFDTNPDLVAKKLAVKIEFTNDENSINHNKISMISGTAGSKSEVRITEINQEAATAFGFVSGIGGGEVGKEQKGTPSGADGIRIKVTGGNLGDRGTVSFVSGFGDQMKKMLGGFLTGPNSIMKLRETAFTRELKNVEDERQRLNVRIDATEKRLKASFQYNDALVAKLNNTLDFVKMQFEAMNSNKK